MKQSGKSTEGQENKICFQHFRRCQKLCTEAFLELNGHLIFSEQMCKTWGFLLKIKGRGSTLRCSSFIDKNLLLFKNGFVKKLQIIEYK